MILLLRGHIRNSFDDDRLYNLVKELIDKYDIKIYIHTWSVQQTNISWRTLQNISTQITNDTIYNYFKDLSKNIKNIIIDDDTKIQLIGLKTGYIGQTKCSTVGWKNMWYGKYQNINAIKLDNPQYNETILNIRFDVQSSFVPFNKSFILKFILQNITTNQNVFIAKNAIIGIDNIYLGNMTEMYKLIMHFYSNLDMINLKYNNIKHQEFLVFYENIALFGNSIKRSSSISIYKKSSINLNSTNHNNSIVTSSNNYKLMNNYNSKKSNAIKTILKSNTSIINTSLTAKIFDKSKINLKSKMPMNMKNPFIILQN